MMLRALLLISSASMGAILFILLRENAAGILQLQGGGPLGLIGAPAPIAGFALAFPAVYLLWEQNDG